MPFGFIFIWELAKTGYVLKCLRINIIALTFRYTLPNLDSKRSFQGHGKKIRLRLNPQIDLDMAFLTSLPYSMSIKLNVYIVGITFQYIVFFRYTIQLASIFVGILVLCAD